MLSKCANPSCSNLFLYLHNGKLFRMDLAEEPEAPKPDSKKPARRVEFFWLCKDCAASMTLSYKFGAGVVAIPVKRVRSAAP